MKKNKVNEEKKSNMVIRLIEEDIKLNKETNLKEDMMRNQEIKMNLSQLELSLVRCCSSTLDKNVEVARCFEVNGFGGVNFSQRLCTFLKDASEKLSKIDN